MNDEFCLDCPVRGDCCRVNVKLSGYNVILEDVYCPYLDTETGLCKDYENRHEHSWCLDGEALFCKGALPKGCLYLREDPLREPIPKIHINNLLRSLPLKKKNRVKKLYDEYNALSFNIYVKDLIKMEDH